VQLGAEGPTVRPPAVAGLFYPADPARLRAEVSELLARAEPAASAGLRSKALIVPHAGYAYSGAVAAAAFAALGEETTQAIRRVVVIGPSHHATFRGIAAPTADAFATPLGRVPVHLEALSGLAGLSFVGLADEPHAPEHALKWSSPSFSCAWGPSRRCRSWSATPIRGTWPGSCGGSGAVRKR
jgi:MEMO1 family protein